MSMNLKRYLPHPYPATSPGVWNSPGPVQSFLVLSQMIQVSDDWQVLDEPRSFSLFPNDHQLPPHLVMVQSFPTLCDHMDCSTPGFLVLHYLNVHWVSDAIQQSHPLYPRAPPALYVSQHQGLCQRVGSLHQVAKVLEFQLQHQTFQRIFRVDFL